MASQETTEIHITESLYGLEVHYGESKVGTITPQDPSGTYAFWPDPDGPLAGSQVARSFDAYTLLEVVEKKLAEQNALSE